MEKRDNHRVFKGKAKHGMMILLFFCFFVFWWEGVFWGNPWLAS